MDSDNSFYIYTEKQFQDKISDSNTSKKPTIFRLAPGNFDVNFNLPPRCKIQGSGIGLTKIIISDKCILSSDSAIEDLTLEFSNSESRENIELFQINCMSYLDAYQKPVDDTYTNTVSFYRVDINLFDINTGYIFSIPSGNLLLNQVKIRHQIIDYDSHESIEMHNLFNLGIYCELSLCQCELDYETKYFQTHLFSGNFSKIKISNSDITFHATIPMDNCVLFYFVNSHLEVNSSKITHKVPESLFLFLDTDPELSCEEIITNFAITDGKLIIQKYVSDNFYSNMYSWVNGLEYQGQKYYFKHILEEKDRFVIDILSDLDIKDIPIVLIPKINFLFSIQIRNSIILENTSQKFREQIITNFLLELQNVNYFNLLDYTNLNLNVCLEKDFTYHYQNGKLELGEIDAQIFSPTHKEQILKCGNGYSLEDKNNVGAKSIDFNLGNSNLSGVWNFGVGNNNISEGNYGIIMGKNNKNYASHTLTCGYELINQFNYGCVLGKYNRSNYNNDNKLLVVGNGSELGRSDALVVYDSGDMNVNKNIYASGFSDGEINIEAGNICGVNNLEVDNLYIDGEIHLDGTLKGTKNNFNNKLELESLEISGDIITVCQLNLEKLESPSHYGGIVSYPNQKYDYLAILNEKKQGLIYQMEVMCVETPNREDLRFIISSKNNFLKGEIPDEEGTKYYDVISSYTWKKGKRIIEIDKFKYDMDYDCSTYYLYLAREVENRNYQDIGNLKLTGKFFIRWRGVATF